MHLYSGYAGWTVGQLDNEIRRGDWHLLSPDEATIFDVDPDEAWQRLDRRGKDNWVKRRAPRAARPLPLS